MRPPGVQVAVPLLPEQRVEQVPPEVEDAAGAAADLEGDPIVGIIGIREAKGQSMPPRDPPAAGQAAAGEGQVEVALMEPLRQVHRTPASPAVKLESQH